MQMRSVFESKRQEELEIAKVAITFKAVVPLFDYVLDENAKMVPDWVTAQKKDLSVISAGFNSISRGLYKLGTCKSSEGKMGDTMGSNLISLTVSQISRGQ